jgi:ubiquinone biosynthesis protein
VASLLSAVRDIERLRQVALVLLRHGFGEVVERSGVGRLVLRSGDFQPSTLAETTARQSLGPRLRMVLEDLGPTFVKLGQILSTRPDLLAPDLIVELKKLQDRVPPVPFLELKEEVEAELGASIEQMFERFDETPLASASIAQVHRARLLHHAPEGDELLEVVVKIQRPKVRVTVERDLELLFLLARAIEQSIPEARRYTPVALVTEFDRAMTAELDFLEEADHAERFRRAFEGRADARFPKVFRAASARKVLTLEYLEGKKPQDAVVAGHSGERIAKTALAVLFKQIFEDGFFHADPHPGNLLILGPLDAPVLGMIDLGLVGRLSPQIRDKTVDLMVAAVRQDAQGVADALYALGTPTRRVNRDDYNADVTRRAEKYLGKPLREISMSALIRDLVTGAVTYGLEIPAEFLMLGRTLMTVEGVGKELYPELDVFGECRPYFTQLVLRRYSPERLGNDALRTLSRLGGTASGLPAKVDEVLDDLRRGELSMRSRDPALPAVAELLGRRLFSGLTVAALIGGGALLVALRPGSETLGYAMLGGAGVWVVGHLARSWLMGREVKRSGS